MEEALNNLLEQAKEYAVLNPDVSQIVLDIEHNKVIVNRKEMTPLDDETSSGLKVYQFMEGIVEDAKAQWEKDFNVWKFKHLDDLTEEELQERVAKELAQLLNTDFLREDFIEASTSKLKRSRLELESMALDVTDVMLYRYTLLRDMVKMEQGRFVVKKATTGRYVQQVKDSLSYNSKKAFIRFATMLKLIYAEIDLMNVVETDGGDVVTSMLTGALASEDAMKYWGKLQGKGFVDSLCHLLPDTSRQQAMYIAESFAEKLELRAKWKPFEELWGINNLAQEKWSFQQTGAMPSRYKEIDEIFED